MWIECPECGAAYDIPDRAIPEHGREVQCSGCRHAWYLLRGAPAPTRPGAAGPTVARPATPVSGGAEAGKPAPRAAPPGAAPPAAAAHPAQKVEADDPGMAALPRRKVDPEILKILREEATVEVAARKAAVGAPPGAARASPQDRPAPPARPTTAPDGPTPPGREARVTVAPVEGVIAPPAQPMRPAKTEDSPARDRLARLSAAEKARPLRPDRSPDIGDEGLVEDLNAAFRDPRPPLMASAPAAPAPAGPSRNLPVRVIPPEQALAQEKRRRTGFRLGFLATAGLCCAALGLYLLAARFGDQGAMPFADDILAQGDRAQTALVNLLRQILSAGIS